MAFAIALRQFECPVKSAMHRRRGNGYGFSEPDPGLRDMLHRQRWPIRFCLLAGR